MAAPKVYVVPIPGCEQETTALKEVLRALGCQITCDDDPISEYARCAQYADFVLIILCETALSNESLAKILNDIRAIGGRVVGVWPPGASGGPMPPGLNTFGYSIVRAEPGDLEKVLIGGERLWLEPNGKPRKAPPTPRHKG